MRGSICPRLLPQLCYMLTRPPPALVSLLSPPDTLMTPSLCSNISITSGSSSASNNVVGPMASTSTPSKPRSSPPSDHHRYLPPLNSICHQSPPPPGRPQIPLCQRLSISSTYKPKLPLPLSAPPALNPPASHTCLKQTSTTRSTDTFPTCPQHHMLGHH